ncbi:sensor domain-containing diguanylate cyclase [Pseudoalteromonas phenolica]|uniref:sensor domain-containing diguanylate cyclase n=1 Tax=Pseudoalteromonas phenolica TaxID=161398 RepID=UPI00110B39D7|nr:sensor domain-containing diguanylate cyclase [Pseudoalteromonas phenolica]TMO56077.1 sensor domain-containing diguanylate cyclase [Pseudoalteromonas phenolica]
MSNICDNLGAYIFAKDMQGKYTYANDKVEVLFGCSKSDIIGKGDSEFFDLSMSQQMVENDIKVLSGQQQVVSEESNFVRNTSEQRVYRIIKSPLFDNENQIIGLAGIAHDVTEEKRLREQVEEQKQLLSIILDNVEAHVYMKDEDRRFLYVNSKVADLFGLDSKEIIGQKEQDILSEETAEHFHLSDSKVVLDQQVLRVEETVIDNEQKYHYLSVKVPVTMAGKRSLIGFSTDVTEIYKLKEEFKRLANTDDLTGIYNRRYFLKEAEKAYSIFKRQNMEVSLLTFDVDYFKKINDRYGHPVGDEVLQNLTAIVACLLRKEDIFARIGGEEFAILLPCTDITSANRVAERVRREVESSLFCGIQKIQLTVSIGLTEFSSKDTSFDDVFSRVDKALYKAKESGRNCVTFLN